MNTLPGLDRRACRRLCVALALAWPALASAGAVTLILSDVRALDQNGAVLAAGLVNDQGTGRLSQVHHVSGDAAGALNGLVADAPSIYTLQAAAEAAGYIFWNSADSNVPWARYSVETIASASHDTEVAIALPGMQTVGSFQFFYDVEGTFYHGLRTQFSAHQVETMLAKATLDVSGNGQRERLFSEFLGVDLSDALKPQVGGSGPLRRDYTVGVKSSRFTFAADTYFPISATLSVETAFVTDYVDGDASLDFISGAGFGNSATLVGIAVFDEWGHAVPDAVATLRDGTRIPVIGAGVPPLPVPEPPSVPLLAAALAAALTARARASR